MKPITFELISDTTGNKLVIKVMATEPIFQLTSSFLR